MTVIESFFCVLVLLNVFLHLLQVVLMYLCRVNTYRMFCFLYRSDIIIINIIALQRVKVLTSTLNNHSFLAPPGKDALWHMKHTPVLRD